MEKIIFKSLDQLSAAQFLQYQKAVQAAFPPIILSSEKIINRWTKIEKYFPSHQIFAFTSNEELIGFANTIPFYWNQDAEKLPDDGWDWMVQKGINDFELKTPVNSLGGLQIIVTKNYLGKGYSKILIAEAKKLKEKVGLQNLFIPIRPTLKHQYSNMTMQDYINYKHGDKLFDPWIRTHINCGARIIKICNNSMNVKGPIQFWEKIYNSKIENSGPLKIEGALSPVQIDIKNDYGEYREPNIWISY